MPTYSKNSLKNLRTANQDLQTLFHYVIQFYDNTIVFGRRTKARQDDIWHYGRYWDGKNWLIVNEENIRTYTQWPDSKHNINKPDEELIPSDLVNAVDSVPYIKGKGAVWNKSQCYAYGGFVMGIAAMLYRSGKINNKIIWGADWDGDKDVNDQKFRDLCHFQTKT